MKRKAFLAIAALAVLCCSAPAFAATTKAECKDWLGSWQFTYDNATSKICFDNASLFNDGDLVICDNDSKDNCTCLDNNTKTLFCIDNTTGEKCASDNTVNCACFDNPYTFQKGKKTVSITNATDNLTFLGKKVPCEASGKQGTTDITIVQVDNATAKSVGIAAKTYIVFEGTAGKFDNSTGFAQIAADNFTKTDNDTTITTQFTAKKELNLLGLVSGVTKDNVTIECELKVFPKKFSKLRAILAPIEIFVITGGSDFKKISSVDWGNDAIHTLIRIRLGKKLIFGAAFVRPFKLEAGDYSVTVTYDTDKEACAPYTVK